MALIAASMSEYAVSSTRRASGYTSRDLRQHVGALHPRHALIADHDGERVPARLQLADRASSASSPDDALMTV